jgi:RimJ/RimL family protein N-acetyltransferase
LKPNVPLLLAPAIPEADHYGFSMMFETDRLLARHFGKEDQDDFAALCADVAVMRFVGDGTTLERAEVARWIGICQEKIRGTWLWDIGDLRTIRRRRFIQATSNPSRLQPNSVWKKFRLPTAR